MLNSTMKYEKDSFSSKEWTDWRWQQRNAVRSIEQLLKIFPGLSPRICEVIRHNQEKRRFQITPYALSLIRCDRDRCESLLDDPLWRQFIPYWQTEGDTAYKYNGKFENWEMPEEMVTPIAQLKYDNRIIVRLANVCQSYCQFCYEALRTLERESSKATFQQKYWEATIEYLRTHKEIEEVILSGGEPLVLMDEQLERLLSDLGSLNRQIAIRIHTRSLTFNPFRITSELVELLNRRKVTAIGLHVTHPNELTQEFRGAVERLRRAAPILFANIPLLGRVNDNVDTMHELVMSLYSMGVMPHYLYHFMPFSPGSTEFRTNVRRGIEITSALKRHISNLAVPEFVLPHRSGKFTIPLLEAQEQYPQWARDASDNPVIRYKNWRGEIVEYLDAPSMETFER